MCTRACDSVAPMFVAVDENVTQVIVQAELQKAVARACDCPSVLVVMIHDQTMSFGTVPESPVMVGTSTGAVLNVIDVIMSEPFREAESRRSP